MNCPDCNVALDERKYRGLEVDHCPQCRGLWLDFDELDLLEDTANRDEILKGMREYARRSGERPAPTAARPWTCSTTAPTTCP